MSKVRFYSVERKDGHKTWSEIVPAPSKECAESYFKNEHVSANANYLGFHEISISYNGQEMSFGANNVPTDKQSENSCDVVIDTESPSYQYLYESQSKPLKKFIGQLNKKGIYP